MALAGAHHLGLRGCMESAQREGMATKGGSTSAAYCLALDSTVSCVLDWAGNVSVFTASLI